MKRISLLALFAIAAMIAPRANAGSITVDDWQIDLSAAAGQGLSGTVAPIDRFTFESIVHGQTLDTNMNGFGDPGELQIVDGLGAVTGFRGNGINTTTSSAGEVLGTDYEMTFDFTVGGVVTGFAAGVSAFTHVGPGAIPGVDGLIDFYIDGAPNAVLDLNPGGTTVAGITDGALVATFRILPGDGGVVDATVLDGTDNATFELVSAAPGVFLDAAGEDLGLLVAGGAEVLLAFANSNFDLDDDNDGIINSGAPAGWTHPRIGTGSPVDFFALEDGSVNLATVPEPTSLLAFAAIGVAGIGARRRRR